MFVGKKQNRKERQDDIENCELFGGRWLLWDRYCIWKRRQKHNKVTSSQGSSLTQAHLVASPEYVACAHRNPKCRNKNGEMGAVACTSQKWYIWDLGVTGVVDVTMRVTGYIARYCFSSSLFNAYDGNFSKLLHIEICLMLKIIEQNIKNSTLKMNSN